MICKNCSLEYDDNLEKCPHCESEIQNKKELKKKTSPKEKRYLALIVSFTLLIFVILGGISFLNIQKKAFEGDSDSVKTVALSSLPLQDKESLEEYVSALSVIFENEADGEIISDDVYKYFAPGREGNLSSAFSLSKMKSEERDPLGRFGTEEREGFYKIQKDEIDSLLSKMGYVFNHSLSLKDCYYFDGAYYFPLEEEKTESKVTAQILSSKRIEDGSYYIECDLLKNKTEKKLYLIVNKEIENEETHWTILKHSLSPLFDNNGVMISSKGLYNYKIIKEQFEGKLSDGTLFCEYTFEYPLFLGDSPAEKGVNRLFEELVSKYKSQSESCDEAMKSMKLKKDALPLSVHLGSKVTFSNEKYISAILELSFFKGKEKNEDGFFADTLEKQYEGYVFSAETGDFVLKDELLGKDYSLISSVLYRIYNDYSLEGLFSSENITGESVPADSEKLGEKIFESAGCLTKDGYSFAFAKERDDFEFVSIPFDVIEKLKGE